MKMVFYLSQFKFIRTLTVYSLICFCSFWSPNNTESSEELDNRVAFEFSQDGLQVSQANLSKPDSLIWDRSGYIVYCPCMGRFGNQAEQFLGALSFAKGLNRTLVLPPWIVYGSYHHTAGKVPFSEWFQVKPFLEYHRVITMEEFMQKIAPTVWPPGKRIGFCYTYRGQKDCGMKDGNPFGPFWDHFHINFDDYREHTGIFWDSNTNERTRNEWQRRYPASEYPVYAFKGVPGSFPVNPEDRWLQKFMKWSSKIDKKAEKFIKENIERPFVGIHLRNGIDFERACEHSKGDNAMDKLFASPQCTNDKTKLTYEICMPSSKKIVSKTKKVASRIKAKSIFIATDNKSYKKELSKAIKGVSFHQWKSDDEAEAAIMDLAILSKADHFIGSCVSTFTAFVKRSRDVQENRPSSFFAVKD